MFNSLLSFIFNFCDAYNGGIINDLTDPDNNPSGYAGLNTGPLWIILLAIISTIVTIITAHIIYKLFKKAYPESRSITKILILIVVTTLALITIYIVLACIGYKETI